MLFYSPVKWLRESVDARDKMCTGSLGSSHSDDVETKNTWHLCLVWHTGTGKQHWHDTIVVTDPNKVTNTAVYCPKYESHWKRRHGKAGATKISNRIMSKPQCLHGFWSCLLVSGRNMCFPCTLLYGFIYLHHTRKTRMSCKENSFSVIKITLFGDFPGRQVIAQLGKYCVQLKHSEFKWKTMLRG